MIVREWQWDLFIWKIDSKEDFACCIELKVIQQFVIAVSIVTIDSIRMSERQEACCDVYGVKWCHNAHMFHEYERIFSYMRSIASLKVASMQFMLMSQGLEAVLCGGW